MGLSNASSALVTIDQVRRDPEVIGFLQAANDTLRTLGYLSMGNAMQGWSVILRKAF